MFKKLCAAVIAVLLISGGTYAGQDFVSAVTMTAQAADADVWDGTYDTSWYDEEETEFHLSTAAEFAGFMQLVNGGKSTEGKTFCLESDIILNDISDYEHWIERTPAHKWTSIGTEKIQFAGTFNAKNHTITGMCTSYGLFRYSTGKIQNVKLASVYANFASICFDNSGTIDNCHAEAVVYSSSDNAGGICGTNSGTINKCTMTGSVESKIASVGGICCLNSGRVMNCRNTAPVICPTVSGSHYAGGIIGYSKNKSFSLLSCHNTGNVTGYYAGGILGYDTVSGTIQDSDNTGIINGGYAGGVLSYIYSSDSSLITTTISNSYNTGEVTGTEDAGGILGEIYISSPLTVEINEAYNTGEVTGTNYTGGILGYAYASDSAALTATVRDSYNTGKVDGKKSGGILGHAYSCSSSSLTINVSNFYNTGEVTGTDYAGGILGYVLTSSFLKADISNSCNTGVVNGNDVGGILGYASSFSSSSSSSVTTLALKANNLYNTGTVNGKNIAGGILGYAYSKASIIETINNAYNAGNLSATQTGGIIGKNENTLSSAAKLTSTLTTCYYLNTTAVKGIGSEATDDAVSKSEANMKKESFAQSLGENFVYVKNNYPKLAWEQIEQPTEEPTEQPTETVPPTSEPATEKPTEATEPSTEPQKQTLKLTEYTETATLKVNYDGNITWLSSNANVATVKDGVVTAVGNGKAIIYALCGEQRVETEVEVSYDYYLNQNEFSLASGTQTQLEFHSANNKEIYNQLAVWTSSNEKVAKVDKEGIITAVSAGTATITAKAGDVSVTCKITVTDSAEPAIFAQSTTIKAGEKKALTISDYSGSVTWVSSDTKIVTVDADGTLTGVKAGTATVYAMLDNGKTISAKITVINSEIQIGDVTLDGEVDILDVITVNKAVLGKETLTAEQIKAADVSKNDVPDSTDALMILKYIVGLLETLG